MLSKLVALALIVSLCLIRATSAAESRQSNNRVLLPCTVGKKICSYTDSSLLQNLNLDGKPALALSYRDSLEPYSNSTWKDWAKTIDARVNEALIKESRRIPAGGKLVVTEVSYTVTADGHITDIELVTPCPDEPIHSRISTNCPLPGFKKIAVDALESLQNSPLLQFPDTSHGAFVRRVGVFSQNYGQLELKKSGD